MKKFFLTLLICALISGLVSAQSPPKGRLSADMEVEKLGHIITWDVITPLRDGTNNVAATFKPKDKKFKEDTASAVSVGSLNWIETDFAEHDKENIVQFTSSDFKPVMGKPYPSFFSGEFKPQGDGNAPGSDSWSAFGGFYLNEMPTSHMYFNVGKSPNDDVNAFAIKIKGRADHMVINNEVENNLESLDVDDFIANYLQYLSSPVGCVPDGNNTINHFLKMIFPKVTFEGVEEKTPTQENSNGENDPTSQYDDSAGLAFTELPIGQPINVIKLGQNCVKYPNTCNHMVYGEFYSRFNVTITPSIMFPSWFHAPLAHDDSIKKINAICNDVKKHEEEHIRDWFKILDDGYYEKWSKSKYIINVCYGGFNGTENMAERDIEEFIASLKKQSEKEYELIKEKYIKMGQDVDQGKRNGVKSGRQLIDAHSSTELLKPKS